MPHKEESAPLGTVSAILNYSHPDKDDKDLYLGTVADKLRKQDPRPVVIRDVRHLAQKPTLERHGFQLASYPTSLNYDDFQDTETVQNVYMEECKALVKEVTGASRVEIPFPGVIRKATPEETIALAKKIQQTEGDHGMVKAVNPALAAHVDQSCRGAHQLLHHGQSKIPKDEVARLSRSRWAILNIWRPLKGPVLRDPLTLCDGRTVDEKFDLNEMNLILPGQTLAKDKDFFMGRWGVKHNAQHEWYYVSEMRTNECWVFKCFDSDDRRTRLAPHCSFKLPDQRDLPARESIEVRCLVFWEDQ